MDATKFMDWEEGNMDAETEVEFFGELVRNGLAWTLQGTYGRTAKRLIDAGYLSSTGEVLEYPDGE
jgi:hypothetical protein